MSCSAHRLRRWPAAAVAFAAALLLAGCAATPYAHDRRTYGPAANPAPSYTAPWEEPVAPAAPASRPPRPQFIPAANPVPPPRIVNIYGEFGGARRAVTPLPAEAGWQQHTASEEGYDADVTADPTGQWLAFASTRHSERADIYVQRTDGASVVQLTADPADDVQPAFSPDGRRIAFCSTRGGNWDVYVMDADGRNVQQVTSSPAQEIHPSFSPDGTRLVYSALSPRSEQWELWVVSLVTGERRFIGQGLFPAWSPQKDVDRIAFQRARQRGSRWFSLWTVDLVENEPRRLTEVAVSTNAAAVSPAWSPDGQRIAFTTVLEPNTPDQNALTDCNDVWVVSADGAARQRVTNGSGLNLSPYWGADNRIYFISDRSGHENIWSVRVEPARVFTANGKAPAAGGSNRNAQANTQESP